MSLLVICMQIAGAEWRTASAQFRENTRAPRRQVAHSKSVRPLAPQRLCWRPFHFSAFNLLNHHPAVCSNQFRACQKRRLGARRSGVGWPQARLGARAWAGRLFPWLDVPEEFYCHRAPFFLSEFRTRYRGPRRSEEPVRRDDGKGGIVSGDFLDERGGCVPEGRDFNDEVVVELRERPAQLSHVKVEDASRDEGVIA